MALLACTSIVQRRASLTAHATAEIGLGLEKAVAHPHLLNSAGDSRMNDVNRLHIYSSKARKPDGLRHWRWPFMEVGLGVGDVAQTDECGFGEGAAGGVDHGRHFICEFAWERERGEARG